MVAYFHDARPCHEMGEQQGEQGLWRGALVSLLCYRKAQAVLSEMSDGLGKMRLLSKAIGQQSGASKDEENLEKKIGKRSWMATGKFYLETLTCK